MKEYYSYDNALEVLKKYCAYQDRCHKEVRDKLISMKVYRDWQDEIIVLLMDEGYLDEMRYAESFVGGKFRMKRWGKNKITQQLKFKEVSSYCIKKAIASQIPDDEYLIAIETSLEKKNRSIRIDNDYKRKQKLIQYGMQQGYEMHLITQTVEEIITSMER